jgi:23S rRNA (adenine2030-N6)-methyltransferase
MNYRHLFHAGNFADVFKHVILTLLLKALRSKDKPFFYLDTHAGAGRYDLGSEAARKTGEFVQGIARLVAREPLPEALREYVTAVRALNRDDELRFYPGSPRVVRHFLRPQDRMVLCEQHPEECDHLKAEFAGDKQVAVHLQDGYLGLKAFLPPPERRGLVLIDPPYESADEFRRAADALIASWPRWRGGTYALWYPIKLPAPVAALHRAMRDSGINKILLAELAVYPENSPFRLNGCGMLVINPPWRLDEGLKILLPQLAGLLRQESDARIRLEWLVPE